MKGIIFLVVFFVLSFQILPQGLFDKVKDKVEDRVDQKTDEAIDKGLDETEEGIEKGTENEDDATAEKPVAETPEQNEETTPAAKPKDEFKTYSKYDFITGENIIFFEDFSKDNIGDFPALWNTNASGEVFTLSNNPGHWFGPGPSGVFVPDLSSKFPENFTFEFDFVYSAAEVNPVEFQIDFISSVPEDQIDALVPGNGGVAVKFGAYKFDIFNWKDSNYGDIANDKNNDVLLQNSNKKLRASFWFQKQRVRFWINETKIFDIPRAVPAGLSLDKIRFSTGESETPYIYLNNMRIAIGAPDMRNKLLTEGKLVTRGILFDVNSDKIKSESYGTLKEIATVLNENADVRVKIIGHTDSDGADAANLDLSKRRAASVKVSLSKDFGIEEARMETDGKGESEPSDKNDTPQGKANNRRVEFIKL